MKRKNIEHCKNFISQPWFHKQNKSAKTRDREYIVRHNVAKSNAYLIRKGGFMVMNVLLFVVLYPLYLHPKKDHKRIFLKLCMYDGSTSGNCRMLPHRQLF
jgi:hypothetical protein